MRCRTGELVPVIETAGDGKTIAAQSGSRSLVKIDCATKLCVQYSFEFLHLLLAIFNPVR